MADMILVFESGVSGGSQTRVFFRKVVCSKETFLRIVEPVWQVAAMPPSQKVVEGQSHARHKAESLFMAVFQEVANRRWRSGGRQVSLARKFLCDGWKLGDVNE